MFAPNLCSFQQIFTNVGNPNTTSVGTSVIPGASNVEGSFTAIASTTDISDDVFWIKLWVSNGVSAGVAKNHLLDIGVDDAGGTSYTARISNIVTGGTAQANNGGGNWFIFPLFIKGAASVAIRIQGSHSTAGTVRCAMWFYGKPNRPEATRLATFSETIGTITNSNGVSFTPGNTGAEGTWVSLGTTANDLWWWQLGVQIDNATTTALIYYFDLAYGDATNKIMIIENSMMQLEGTSEANSRPLDPMGYMEVPAGSELFIRGTSSGTAVTGFNAVAIGTGG